MYNEKIVLTLKGIVPNHPEERRYYFQHLYRYQDTLTKIPLANIEGKFIVDLGAIPGHITQAVSRLGAKRVVGLDYDPSRFGFQEKFTEAGIELLKCDLRKDALPFDARTVDTIIFTEVIEHLPDPHPILKEIYRILKNDGTVVVTTPNINNLANRIRRILGKPIYPTRAHMGEREEQQHTHEYTMNEVKHLFVQNGFSVISNYYIAGTEKALIHKTMPTKLPNFVVYVYASVPMIIPPLRSYLFLLLNKFSAGI